MTVPFIGPRGRFNILGVNPTWVVHQMDGAAPFNGEAPRTAAIAANDLDPAVSAGKAEFGDATVGLTEGGLFTLLGNYRQHVEVLAVDDTTGGGTKNIVAVINDVVTTVRPIPTAPFQMTPGEYLSVSGGANGSKYGVLVKLAGEKIL